MRFLLDTNAVIALLNEPGGSVARQARCYRPAEIGLSAIVSHELSYGAFKSRRRGHNLAIVDGLRLEVLPFDQDDARSAGELRVLLTAAGTPIGPYDLLIAGQARSRGLVLVTRNQREFERLDGLKIENWESD